MNRFDDNFMRSMEEIQKINNKTLREIFKGRIKESFLMKMLYKIMSNQDFINNQISLFPSFYSENIIKSSILGNDNVEFDICSHIVGCHRFNTMLMTDSERGYLQDDSKYQSELEKQVIEQIFMREYGSSTFRKRNYFSLEEYLYYPVLYDLYVLTTIFTMNFDEYLSSSKHDSFISFILISVLKKAIAVLAMFDYNTMENAYGICRSMIELYVVFIILNLHPNGITTYRKFLEYKINYDKTGVFDWEFEKLYSNKTNVNKMDYLNYGWIDSIVEFGYLEKRDRYSFSQLTDFIDLEAGKDDLPKKFGTRLKTIYNSCHIFSHGNLVVKTYQFSYVVEIANMLFITVGNLAAFMNEKRNMPFEVNGINVLKRLERDISKLSDINFEFQRGKLPNN